MADCVCAGYNSVWNPEIQHVELGPAYDDFVNDDIRIGRQYSRRSLPDWLTSDCCIDRDVELFLYRRKLHIALATISVAVTSTVILLVWLNRDDQPIKYRRADHLTAHLIFIAIGFIGLVLNASADTTGSCLSFDFLSWFFTPVILMFYIVKGLQFAYIYNWNYERIRNNKKLTSWFYKYKWIAGSWVYPISCTVVFLIAVFGVIIPRQTASQYSGETLLESATCHWWQIPNKYTAAVNSSSMCACYNATYGGDTSYRDPCGTEFYALCTNSAPLPPWDSEKTTRLCESCAQGLDSVDCVQNMAGWFSTGACGYPSEMPDFSSCKSCFSSNPEVLVTWSSYIFILLIATMTIGSCISRLKDELVLQPEILFSVCVAVPLLLLVLAKFLFASVNDKLSLLDASYPFHIYAFLLMYGCFFISSGIFPLIVCYYWRYRDNKFALASQKSAKITTIYSGSISSLMIQVQHGELSELIFAIENADGSQVYGNFSWREFTVENFLFLKAVRGLYEVVSLLTKTEDSAEESLETQPGNSPNQERFRRLLTYRPSIVINESHSLVLSMSSRRISEAVPMDKVTSSSNSNLLSDMPLNTSHPADFIEWLVKTFVIPSAHMEINIPGKTKLAMLQELWKLGALSTSIGVELLPKTKVTSRNKFGASLKKQDRNRQLKSSSSSVSIGDTEMTPQRGKFFEKIGKKFSGKTAAKNKNDSDFLSSGINDKPNLSGDNKNDEKDDDDDKHTNFMALNDWDPDMIISVLQALQPSVDEIARLLLRDSWPRFRASPKFSQFMSLQEKYETEEDVFNKTI